MGLAGFRRNGSAWGDGDGGLILTCSHFSFIHSSSLVCATLRESSLPSHPIASVSYRIVSRIGYYMHPFVFLSFFPSFFFQVLLLVILPPNSVIVGFSLSLSPLQPPSPLLSSPLPLLFLYQLCKVTQLCSMQMSTLFSLLCVCVCQFDPRRWQDHVRYLFTLSLPPSAAAAARGVTEVAKCKEKTRSQWNQSENEELTKKKKKIRPPLL